METRVFRYRIHFGNEINRERWVDQEVNLPEERRPRRSIETRVFRYRMHFGNEIKSKKWLTRSQPSGKTTSLSFNMVDQEVNIPGCLVDREVNLPEENGES